MNEELERCRPWIEAALEYSGGTHDFIDVAEGIYKGTMQLWPTPRGCIVTEIVVYPRKKVLNVFLGGGELDQILEMHEDVIAWAKAQGHLKADSKPLSDSVAAVSVGIIGGVPMLDLCYEEDVRAGTDMNVVVAGDGRFIEVQGTAEGEPFDRALLNQLLDLAVAGCATLNQMQKDVLAK